MKNPITLRGMATADAVRRFESQRVPMVVQPIAEGAEIPPGWLPVLLATTQPKHKSPSTIRRNEERRRQWRVVKSTSNAGESDNVC